VDGNSSTPLVVTLGETMVAMVAREAGPLRYASSFERRIAGAESNVAVGLVRLGVRSGWIGGLGDDEFGRYVFSTLRGEGVDVSHVCWETGYPTGVMFKERRAAGKSRVLYYRKGSAASHLTPEKLPDSYLRQADHLHLTGITPALSDSCAAAALTAVSTVRASGGTVSFDVNLRDQLRLDDPLQALLPFMRAAEILFLGFDEARRLFGIGMLAGIERALDGLGVPTVILKLGAEGAKLRSHEREGWIEAPAFRVSAVDEVGAGDAFAAAYLASTLLGRPPEEALGFANAAGALATTVPGDIEGLGGWDDLDELARDPAGRVRR
jgi:2-dehydro-3-deoxygluconokinase